MLYILAGLPAAGKSTLAKHLAQEQRAVHLRIDTIEQALRETGSPVNGPEGYVVAYGVAADNLRLGLSVVAHSVNPLQITRGDWCRDAVRRDRSHMLGRGGAPIPGRGTFYGHTWLLTPYVGRGLAS
jgi:predicted kinase